MRTIGTLALVLLLTSCGGGSEPKAEPTQTVTVTVTTTPEASEADPTSDTGALSVGDTYHGPNADITVLDVKSDAHKPPYLKGMSDAEGVLVKAQICDREGGQTIEVMSDAFVGVDADGGQYTASGSSWDEWPPRPQYPFDSKVRPGDCVSGWILLSAESGTKLSQVAFVWDGETIVTWDV